MKAAMHPFYGATSILCACGATYPTRSRSRSSGRRLRRVSSVVDRPAEGGDPAGRVEQFQRRYGRNNAHSALVAWRSAFPDTR